MSYPNADPAQYPPGATKTASDRRSTAFVGGMLAGIAIAIALAVVMHVIQEESPNGPSIGRSVGLVLFLGLIIGLGLGMGLAAAVPPEGTADSAAPGHPTLADQPPAAGA